MIACELCGYTHEYFLSSSHLRNTHSISIAEYRQKFPSAKIRAQPLSVREKSSMIKRGKPSKLRGVKKSQEHCLALSVALKKNYANGTITHWNTGLTTPADVRSRIAEGNRNATNNGNLTQRTRKHERIIAGAAKYDCSIMTINDSNHRASAQCNKCLHVFSFTQQVFYLQRLDKIGKLCPACNPRKTFTSKGERELYEFVASIEHLVIQNDRQQLGGYELDVYVPNKRVAFEYTGLYWHAEEQNPDNNHLLNKTRFAAKLDINLITIYEDEWITKRRIVESRVRAILGQCTRKYYARKTIIKLVDDKMCTEFLIRNHIQGANNATCRLGLFHDNELIQLATFIELNTPDNKNNATWELNRLCGKLDTVIVGGASKLISAFKYLIPGVRLLSYADRRWTNGAVHKTLGFKFLSATAPSYWHLDKKYIRRQQESYVDCTSPVGHCHHDRIWDCGTTKWVLE